jgi:hypothetical protein
MEYILIPTKSKSETVFFLDLLKKMRKEASLFTSEEMEDTLLLSAMKDAESEGIGSFDKAKAHLKKVAAGK